MPTNRPDSNTGGYDQPGRKGEDPSRRPNQPIGDPSDPRRHDRPDPDNPANPGDMPEQIVAGRQGQSQDRGPDGKSQGQQGGQREKQGREDHDSQRGQGGSRR